MRRGWIIVLALLLAFALGVHMLNADVLWFDEAKTVFFTGAKHFGPLTPAQVWDNLAQNDPWQTPGYFITLTLWAQLVGWTDFAARSLSLFAGLIALSLTIWTARVLKISPIYTAIILVGSTLYIHYLHELRPYAFVLLFSALTVGAYWRALHRPTARAYALFGIGLVGLAYTHVLALFVAVSIGVYHLLLIVPGSSHLTGRARLPMRQWLLLVGVMGMAALTFLPWLGVILKIIGLAQNDTLRQAEAFRGAGILSIVIEAFSSGSPALLLVLLGIALLDGRPTMRYLWLLSGIAFAGAMAISLVVPAFIHVRYVFMMWPLLALLTTRGITQLGRFAPFIAAVWLINGVSHSLDTRYLDSLPNSRITIAREGYMQMVDAVMQPEIQPALLVSHASPPGQEWDSDDTIAYYLPGIPYTHMERIRPIVGEAQDDEYRAAVTEVVQEWPLVWASIVPEVPFTRRRLAFFQALEQTHVSCGRWIDRNDMTLDLYARKQGSSEPLARFTDGAAQLTASLLWPPTPDSNSLNVGMLWQTQDAAFDTYSFGVHVLDASGVSVRQSDTGIPNGDVGCRTLNISLDGLPEGDYQAILIAYRWQTQENLMADSAQPIIVSTFHR